MPNKEASDLKSTEVPAPVEDWVQQPFILDIPHREPLQEQRRLPSPLLGSERTARTQTHAIQHEPRAGRTVSTERNAEPTEVHVHIGRIDITAENAPAAARPPPATARKTLSLENYLTKRHRRVP